MKRFFLLSLLISLSAEAYVFDCRDGDSSETLILEDHSAKIADLTLINMLPIDDGLPLRVYTFIHDPWYDLEVDPEMVTGGNGNVHLWSHELQYGQTIVSRYFECNRKR